MSQFSIHQYLSEVEKIIHDGGTKKETAIQTAFYNLLNEYAKAKVRKAIIISILHFNDIILIYNII